MEAPKCKLCGANHWSTQPHVGFGQPKPAAPSIAVEPKAPVKAPSKAAKLAAAKAAAESVKPKKQKSPTGRVAPGAEAKKGGGGSGAVASSPAATPKKRRPGYMAEYQRKRRAKLKEAK
jgi:hypothetical protein